MQFSSNWRYCRRLLTLYKKKLLILPLEFLADLSKTVQEECLPLSGYLCLQIFTPRELSFRGLDKTHKSAKLTFLPIETLCIFVFLSFCLLWFLPIETIYIKHKWRKRHFCSNLHLMSQSLFHVWEVQFQNPIIRLNFLPTKK